MESPSKNDGSIDKSTQSGLENGELSDFRKQLEEEVNHLVTEFMPSKIVQLGKLSERIRAHVKNLSESEPVNPLYTDLVKEIKLEVEVIFKLMSRTNTLMSLKLPRVDAQGFETSVQGEIIGELKWRRQAAAQILEDISDYYRQREDISKHIDLHPTIEDYRNALKHLDEAEAQLMIKWSHDLQNGYVVLVDMINKNIENLPMKGNSPKSKPPLKRSGSIGRVQVKRKKW